MAMDDCDRLEPEISALLDGELAGPEAAAVEAHVRACPACSVLARDLATVGRALRSWDAGEPAAPVSPGFRARVLARVAPEWRDRERREAERRASRPGAARPEPVPPSRVRLLPRLLPAAAAAASIAAALGAGVLFRGTPAEGPLDAGPAGEPSVAPARPASVAELLDLAGRHRAGGRSDLERRAVLAAYGVAPADPGVREAFGRALGFDPSSLERDVDGAPAGSGAGSPGGAFASGRPVLPPDPAAEVSSRDLWIGSWRFESPGAYDDFLGFRERKRDLEIKLAAREAARGRDTTSVAAARPEPPAPDPLSRTLSSLSVGAPVGGGGAAAYQGIVVYPLRASGPPAPMEATVSLPEALGSGRAVVRDNPGRGAGSVLVTNLDEGRPLLVLAGEVLEGGRADRMAARDVLVAPGARNVPVPVYDVEAGRGSTHPYGSKFRGVPGVAGPRLRALALGRAAPEEVRDFLGDRLDLLFVTKTRRSLADAYDDGGPAVTFLRSVRPQVQEILRGLQGSDVVGFAVAQGKELLAVEVFGSHGLLVREAPRILEGCALEASTYPGGGRSPTTGAVKAMLAAAGLGAPFGDAGGVSPEVGVVALEGGLLGSGVARGEVLLHASVLRGAASGALAGRSARSGDLPGGGGKPDAAGASAGSGGTKPEGESDTDSDSESSSDTSGGAPEPKPGPVPPPGDRPK